MLPDWPLRRLRLLTLGEGRWRPVTPPLWRPVVAAVSVERLVAGDPPFADDAPVGALAVEVEGPTPEALVLADPARVARILDALAQGHDPAPVVLIGPPGSGRRTVARAHALAAGRVLLRVEPAALPMDAAGFDAALGALLRDARLADGVVLLRADALADKDDRRLGVLARLVEAMRPAIVVSVTPEAAPAVTAALPAARIAALEGGDVDTRKQLYARLLVQHAFDLSRRQLGKLVDTYRLHPGDLDRALVDVRATSEGEGLERRAFDRAVRRQVRSRLGDLATPITTSQRWEDLVVDEEQRATIDEIIAHARHRTEVFEDWGFAGKIGGRGRGLACLFSGPPGTGKTMTASLIAKALELECYLVDLSRVVDKYIGETEKNLGRLFDEASRAPVVLLFDEADSLFAARTQVESSNDRYANLEVNFLLQRMERFEGISVLTTNRETAIDPAFKRRLRFRLHFDLPGEADRERLWRTMVPPGLPIAPDIDWLALARQWEMSGAIIRNAMLRAAFLAAARKRPLDELLIREAARSELFEMGRLGS
ncbi:MAG: ATP-binding protein [bacterium]